MATVSVKTRVDVAVSTYMDITGANDQPDATVGLLQSALPTGYFTGGSHLTEIATDDDITYNSVAGNELAADTAEQIVDAGDACVAKTSGTLILRNSGKTTADKDVDAAANADISIYVGTAGATTLITTLSVANKDVFVIPQVTQAMSVFEAKTPAGSGTVFLEYTCICD